MLNNQSPTLSILIRIPHSRPRIKPALSVHYDLLQIYVKIYNMYGCCLILHRYAIQASSIECKVSPKKIIGSPGLDGSL
jgi:hypothetical protein